MTKERKCVCNKCETIRYSPACPVHGMDAVPSQEVHEKWCDVEIEKNPKCTCGKIKFKPVDPLDEETKRKIKQSIEHDIYKAGLVEDTQPSGEWGEWKENFLKHLSKWSYFSADEELEKGREILLLTQRSKLVELLENAAKDIHGGGNGRRIIEQVLAHLKSNLK